jgi:hypothetical protein
MTSDDQVQNEGVQSLLTVSKEFIPKEDAIFLVFNVVQLLIKKAAQIENSKIAVLMIMEQFATNDFFMEKECMMFLNTHFANFLEGALFKIKKHLIPCMLALSKHTSYEVFKSTIIS